jgi:hypothetical protein
VWGNSPQPYVLARRPKGSRFSFWNCMTGESPGTPTETGRWNADGNQLPAAWDMLFVDPRRTLPAASVLPGTALRPAGGAAGRGDLRADSVARMERATIVGPTSPLPGVKSTGQDQQVPVSREGSRSEYSSGEAMLRPDNGDEKSHATSMHRTWPTCLA